MKTRTSTAAFLACLALFISTRFAEADALLKTRYATLRIDDNGFITSLTARNSGKEYSPAGHPSPLLSLHESGQPNDKLLFPRSAAFLAGRSRLPSGTNKAPTAPAAEARSFPAERTYWEIELKYANGAVAVVKVEAKEDYFRFQLAALTPRGNIDNIVWGPLHTTISKIIGDLIGVVREDDWAIGMCGLDDNTIAGPVEDSDCYGMGYYIHSPDPKKYPLPPQYHEGQWFNIGGDGVSDTAFYSHPEEYFQQVFGSGAKLEPAFGSTLAYHARDRRRSYNYLWSLLPGFKRSRPRHMVSDPVAGVDFIGSAVALYACPDDQGLATIEKIILAEGLPHIVIDGKWVRDPATCGVTLNWNGPYDKCIEYAQALGVRDVSRETAEFYPCLGNHWSAGNVGFAHRPPMSFKEFTEDCHRNGLSHGGLHTLCVFLQGGISHDVTPVPSPHLQTVCRTKLARDINPTDTQIVVTDPSFLADKGTWTQGDDSNYLRIGGEMLRYAGISETAPYTLKGVQRGHASKALPHKAGDEIVKLMQNCYNGFVPDIERLPEYADYYADLMVRNGMDAIGFDGFESTVYQNHGYYGTRIFCRRLFETYARLTGGKAPRVTGSNVFAGAWEYMNACNVGGGDNMFNARTGRRGIEGKDIGNGFSNSYYPATFGIQGWHSDWSLYDAENLQAKAVGWDATYAFSVSQNAIDRSGERDAIFTAFRAWQVARASALFSKEQKRKLRDPDSKFHLEQTGEKSFRLYPVKETTIKAQANNTTTEVAIANPYESQALQFALRLHGPANGIVITLPDGSQIKSDEKIAKGQFVICKGKTAYRGDDCRKKIAALPSPVLGRGAGGEGMFSAGEAKIGIGFPGAKKSPKVPFELTVWTFGPGEAVGK
jgi:hypothetical protein